MQIQFTGHNIEITPALKEFTTNKFSKLQRFAEHIVNVHITFNVNKVRQMVEAQIKLHGSDHVHAHSESDNMYAAIDELMDKITRQLTKHKEKHDQR